MSVPFIEGQLSFKNGERVILTCSKDNIKYRVAIIVRFKSVKPMTFGETVLPFTAVFEAVNHEEEDPIWYVQRLYCNLKSEYINELEERLVKYETI